MAQYKHNFYGTSYYGETNAYSGIYETNSIDTEETLRSTANYKIKAKLPTATYRDRDAELLYNESDWTRTYYSIANGYCLTSMAAGTEINFHGTCDKAVIHFIRSSGAATDVRIDVVTKLADGSSVTNNYTLNTSTTLADHMDKFELTGLQYGAQHIRIYLPSTHVFGEILFFASLEIAATHVTVETRASYNDSSWTAYTKVSYTKTLIEGSTYYLEGTTPSYTGKNRIQVKIFMASSDNEISPIIEDVLLTAGDTDNRTPDGKWIADINMAAVATNAGLTFSRVLSIDWEDSAPSYTKIYYRSSSSTDGTTWGALSVPYVKGTNRVRLREGKTFGHITTPLLDSSAHNPNLRNMGWFRWTDKSHIPPDRVQTGFYYELLDSSNRVMYTVSDARRINWRQFSRVIRGKPFKLRIQFYRRFDKSSPAVDEVNFKSRLFFTEDKVITTTNISSVDANNTGEKIVYDMSSLTYNLPTELTPSSMYYKLIDGTSRPAGTSTNDIYIYLDSQKNKPERANVTTNHLDKIWAVCVGRDADNAGGLLRHYQYGGGLSYYETNQANIKRYDMTSGFTPSLVTSKKYRYYVQSGWPTQYHVVQQGQTLNAIALLYGTTTDKILALSQNLYLNEPEDVKGTSQSAYNPDNTIKEQHIVEIPNETINSNVNVYWDSEKAELDANRDRLTEASVQNGATSNDSVMGEVLEAFAKGQVDWVSDEKIYEGVINLNNVTTPYAREHVIPDSGEDEEHEHIVEPGETYESIANDYDIYEEDLRWKNNARDKLPTDSPEIGAILVIPSKIVLPIIPSDVEAGTNPYAVEIVYNSVKVGNEILREDIINNIGLEVVYEKAEKTREPVVRGSTANGVDVLPDSNILKVIAVYDTLNETVAAPYYIAGTDYTSVGNYIDWSLSGSTSKEPVAGATYYVSYEYNKPVGVRMRINSDYKVQTGSDRLWRSKEIKEFSGTCEPGKDFRKELPQIKEWPDYNTQDVYGIEYIIEDNDLWVKTWIEEKNGKSYIVGSLMGKRPKDNWHPYVHTGFYYLGKDEYYLFSEPKQEALTKQDVPIAKNVKYAEGKYGNAAHVQPQSTNLVRNSGFQVATSNKVVRKITFDDGSVAELGITN